MPFPAFGALGLALWEWRVDHKNRKLTIATEGGVMARSTYALDTVSPQESVAIHLWLSLFLLLARGMHSLNVFLLNQAILIGQLEGSYFPSFRTTGNKCQRFYLFPGVKQNIWPFKKILPLWPTFKRTSKFNLNMSYASLQDDMVTMWTAYVRLLRQETYLPEILAQSCWL